MSFNPFGQVYLPLGKDFFKEIQSIDIDKLIYEFALVIEKDDNNQPLLSPDGTPALGKTKGYIAKKACAFIQDLDEYCSTSNAASYVSKRQIKKLSKAFREKKGSVSCYSLIILHVMFSEIIQVDNTPGVLATYKDYASVIHALVNEYYKFEPTNDLAEFLIRCYTPVMDEFTSPENLKSIVSFPPIPKRCVHPDADE